MNLKERARKIKNDIPALFIAIKEKDIPIAAKVSAGLVIVYALSPVDLIPDFIPILGYLDDLVVLPALIALTVHLIPNDVMDRCRVKAKNNSDKINAKKWYYVRPFIFIWLFLFMIIARFIFSFRIL